MNRIWRVIFWVVVAASLLVNAVVLGVFLRAGEMRGIINGGGGGFANLPPEVKQEFRAVLRENRGALQGPLRDLGQARRAMFDAAAARPYDRAAVQAAMERVRTASADVQRAGQVLLLQAFDNAAAGP
jgi:uncharacterized membrane protein